MAQDLLWETVSRHGIQLVMISEPNKRIASYKPWFLDSKLDAGIIVIDPKLKVTETGKGDGFVWVRITGVTIFSCYISPNISFEEYNKFLDSLGCKIRTNSTKVIVAGDLNAKSPEWGSPSEDRRGRLVTEWLSSLNLTVINNGRTPTFERGQQKSYIDVTLCSEDVSRYIKNWEVLNEETGSYHNYIKFQIDVEENSGRTASHIYKYGKLDKERFKKWINTNAAHIENLETPENYVETLQEASRISTPRVRIDDSGQPPYWWTLEIQESRRDALTARRKYTRYRRRQTTYDPQKEIELQETYRRAKKALANKIRTEKRRCWLQLCQKLESDPWGDAYQIVKRALKVPIPKVELTVERRLELAKNLFPRHPRKEWNVKKDEIPTITQAEVLRAAERLREGKSAGPDRVLPEATKLFTQLAPKQVAEIMNTQLKKGEFPKIWKTASLVLIPKPKSTAFRPICLLDTPGKLYEHIILGRLNEEIERTGGLSEHQHGFRKNKTTYGAIEEVMERAKTANIEKKWCALILLDVQNAFNTTSWQKIIDEMRSREMSNQLVRIIASYLSDRCLQIDKNNNLNVSAGVPQGSVLGPTLWNLLYDGVFRENIPVGAQLVAYADDLAVTVTEATLDDLEISANDTLQVIDKWMQRSSLKLAPEKTEAVVLYGNRRPKPIRFMLNNTEIVPSKTVKYLGVTIDQRMSFTEHINRATEKADKVAAALTRVMPNIGGPKPERRQVLTSVVHSIILYGAPIWLECLNVKKNLKKIIRSQRKIALRVISAYRTVSTEAALVLAGIIPIDLLAEERDIVYRETGSKKEAKIRARERSLQKWQNRWDTTNNASWTRSLIKQIKPWLDRKHGQTDYFLTQFLTGHGRFASYRNKIGLQTDRNCYYCGLEDTPQHTVFDCEHFRNERRDFENLNPDNIIEEMLSDAYKWNSIKKTIVEIIETKEREEHRRTENPNP